VMTVDVVENGRSQVGYEYVRDRVAQQTIHENPIHENADLMRDMMPPSNGATFSPRSSA